MINGRPHMPIKIPVSLGKRQVGSLQRQIAFLEQFALRICVTWDSAIYIM